MDWQWRTLHTEAKQESVSLYPDTLSTNADDVRDRPHAKAAPPSHLTVRATKKSVQDHGLCGLVRARCSVTFVYVVAVRCRIVWRVTRFWAWLCLACRILLVRNDTDAVGIVRRARGSGD